MALAQPAHTDDSGARRDSRPDARLALLEAFVDTASDAMFSIDAAGRIAIWNRSAVRLFGHEAEEICGNEWNELFPEHLRGAMQTAFDAVAAGDRIERYEGEIERRDGMSVPVSLSVCPVVTGETLVGTIAVIRDVTEQRLAQTMLAESEARLREGEALAHVGRWQWDVATDAVQWSDEFHRIHGVDPLDFGGTLAAQLSYIHADDRERVQAAVERSVESGRAADEEFRIVRPDGSVRRIHTRAEPTFDSAGDVVALRGVGQDITDQRHG